MDATRSFQFFSNFLLSTITKSLRNQNQRWLHPLYRLKTTTQKQSVHTVHPEKVRVFRNCDAEGKVLWTETPRKKQRWGPAFLSCSFFFKGHYFSLLSNDFSIVLQLDMRPSKSSIRLTTERDIFMSLMATLSMETFELCKGYKRSTQLKYKELSSFQVLLDTLIAHRCKGIFQVTQSWPLVFRWIQGSILNSRRNSKVVITN